ncbi:MAG: efflux RND transporter periplasmic adaptor subunit [Planctomycetes bacterium]|nr:efflux RND transporter periplasmic adaptor subunit [Planctomycetota bacterium]
MRWIFAGVSIVVVLLIGGAIAQRLRDSTTGAPTPGGKSIAAVEVGRVTRGSIAERRVYSGTLEARAEFVVAPKVGGRIEKLYVDLSDEVQRGQVVAELDDDEYAQAVAEAEADLAVARANVVEAERSLEIVDRELDRLQSLLDRGVASESEMDSGRAERLAKVAALDVAKARVQRADASLAAAKIRLGYTRVTADWSDPDPTRIVAERMVDDGQTVSANAPLMTIVDLHPITGVIFATEKDYSRLRVGQQVQLTTDAFPQLTFAGTIERIAPVFRPNSRQARIELAIDNEDHRLKPGMFVRSEVVLERVEETTIVPIEALATRGGSTGVFVLLPDGKTVAWRSVIVGIREAGRAQVEGENIDGWVVTLGQQLIDDGSEVSIPIGGPAGAKAGGTSGTEPGA